MKHPTSMKWVAFAVIVLFIGLAFAPSVNANVSKEDELVEVATEFCGINGKKHSIQLTQEQADELDMLFNSIKERLDKVESQEKTIEIFNDAIVELDKYGLLGGLRVEQAQKLTTGRFQNIRMKLLDELNERNQKGLENTNWHCLIAGELTHTFFMGFLYRIIDPIVYFLWDRGNPFSVLLFFISWVIGAINIFQPIFIGCNIEPTGVGAEGWVKTVGLLGVKVWNGILEGQIKTITSNFTAVVGFTGIHILRNLTVTEPNFFLGYARLVEIDYKE